MDFYIPNVESDKFYDFCTQFLHSILSFFHLKVQKAAKNNLPWWEIKANKRKAPQGLGDLRSPWLKKPRVVRWSSTISTWRIIPFSKWLINMVIVSPLTGATFPFQMAELHGL